MNTLQKPYEGSEKYIFISYAHKDMDIVLPIIERFQDDGFRVWYDEGIDPGTEWAKIIADHLDNCECFISMMSKNYLASDNCKNELEYARNLKNERFIIYIEEDVDMPNYLKMNHGRLQNMNMTKYSNESAFYDKLFGTSIFAPCRDASASAQNILKASDNTSYVTDMRYGRRGKYTGQTKNGVPHGTGKLIRASGSVYEGNFVDGNRHGYGTMTYADGRVEQGRWENNKFIG